MAVKLESTIKRFIGLSTDDKPMYETSSSSRFLPAGSSFLESDTGRIYRFDGATWTYAAPSEGTEILLSQLVFEVRQLRELVQLVTA